MRSTVDARIDVQVDEVLRRGMFESVVVAGRFTITAMCDRLEEIYVDIASR